MQRVPHGLPWPAALGVALAAYLLASLLWLAPLWRHFDSAVLDGPTDSVGTLSDYWAAEQLGESIFTFDHNPYNGAPEGYPRSPTLVVANAYQPLLFHALDWLIGDVGAWNAITVAGFVLSALAAFALLRSLRLSLATCLLGGYVFGFGPWMFARANAGHGSMQHLWVLPLLFALCLALHRSPRMSLAAAAGAVVALAMYVHSYVGLMALVLAAAFYALELVLAGDRLRTLALAGCSALTTVVLFAPPLWLYLRDRSGLQRSLAQPFSDLEEGGATLRDYLLPSDLHPLLGSLRPDDLGHEHVLFWGWSTIVAAAVGAVVVLRRRDPDPRRYAALLALAAGAAGFVVSLKPVLHVLGLPLYTPSWAIGQFVTFWRAYARIGVVVALALVVLAAFAFEALLGRRRGPLLAAAAALLVGLELAVGVPVRIWRTDAMPAHVQWLRDHPGGIVANYPLPVEERFGELAAAENWNVVKHGHPLFALWGGNNAGTREEAVRILASDIDNPLGLRVLTALGVRYIVVHEDVYEQLGLPVPDPGSRDIVGVFERDGKRILRPNASVPNLNRLLLEQSSRIAQARAFPPALVEKSGGWNAPEEFHDGRMWTWMTQGGRIAVDVELPGPYYVVFDAAANAEPRTVTVRIDGRAVAATRVETFAQRVRLGPFRLRGETVITLAADPGPRPLGETRVGSVFVSPVEIRPAPAFFGRLNR